VSLDAAALPPVGDAAYRSGASPPTPAGARPPLWSNLPCQATFRCPRKRVSSCALDHDARSLDGRCRVPPLWGPGGVRAAACFRCSSSGADAGAGMIGAGRTRRARTRKEERAARGREQWGITSPGWTGTSRGWGCADRGTTGRRGPPFQAPRQLLFFFFFTLEPRVE